eukprot:gnl/MRDRNA2_/MRDRNA2_124718_c0_seq1.p1 gnl/MRDRNA2_/MRDRNA2_124718_c0~~gnl/MRDRNA2_/MRDRNA2_124718_c0_seq1.p1  ORF type:complete len:792 (+),score=147.75 gnl/MRDRNA2_/MRDRNA2_124718_c0_seq1:94-2469(+)
MSTMPLSSTEIDKTPGVNLPFSLAPLKTNIRDAQRLRQQSIETTKRCSVRGTVGGLKSSSPKRKGSDSWVNSETRDAHSSMRSCNSPKRSHSSKRRPPKSSSSNGVTQDSVLTQSSEDPSRQDRGIVPHAPRSKRESKSVRKRKDRSVVKTKDHHFSRDDKEAAMEKAATVATETHKERQYLIGDKEVDKVAADTLESSVQSLTASVVSTATAAAVQRLQEKEQQELISIPLVKIDTLHDQASPEPTQRKTSLEHGVLSPETSCPMQVISPSEPIAPQVRKRPSSGRRMHPTNVSSMPSTDQPPLPACGPSLTIAASLDGLHLEIESPSSRIARVAEREFSKTSSRPASPEPTLQVIPSTVPAAPVQPEPAVTRLLKVASEGNVGMLMSMGYSQAQAEDAVKHCATLDACLDWITAAPLRNHRKLQSKAERVEGTGKDMENETDDLCLLTDEDDPCECTTTTCGSVSSLCTAASVKSEESDHGQQQDSDSPGMSPVEQGLLVHSSCKKPECPKGHKLDALWTPADHWSCSTCKKAFKKGTLLHGCRTCNYDECANCYDKKIFSLSTCPNSHKLAMHSTPVDNWSCSLCENKFPAGTELYGCRECNYDECSNCFAATRDAKATIQRRQSRMIAPPSMPKLGFLRRFSRTSKSSAEKHVEQPDGAHATGISVVPAAPTFSKHFEETGESQSSKEHAAASLDAGQSGDCTCTHMCKMLLCKDTISPPISCAHEHSTKEPASTKFLYSDEDPPAPPENSNTPEMLSVMDEERPKTDEKTEVTECKIMEKTEEIEV